MTDLDERLRIALGSLGATAEQHVRPPGADAIPAAGRRYRRTALGARTAVAIVVAGATATGWWAVREHGDRGAPAASGSCAPADAAALMPNPVSNDLRDRIGSTLGHLAGVTAPTYESTATSYERFKAEFMGRQDDADPADPHAVHASWRFGLRCAKDYPAVKAALGGYPGVVVVCSCARAPDASPPR